MSRGVSVRGMGWDLIVEDRWMDWGWKRLFPADVFTGCVCVSEWVGILCRVLRQSNDGYGHKYISFMKVAGRENSILGMNLANNLDISWIHVVRWAAGR